MAQLATVGAKLKLTANNPYPTFSMEYNDHLWLFNADGEKVHLGATPEELAQRYAEYKVRRNAPLTGWSYSEEQREKKVKNQMKTINKKLKERKETE